MNRKQKTKFNKLIRNKQTRGGLSSDYIDNRLKEALAEMYPNNLYGKCNKIYSEFKYKYFSPVIDFFRYDLPNGYKSIVEWFPIIWKDRHWDYGYLYIILEYKLNKMHDCIANGYTASREEDLKKIQQCLFLIKRIKEDNYSDSLRFKELDLNVGFLEAMDYEEYMRRNDVQTLFKIIANNIHRWWD